MKHGSLFSGIGGFDLAAEWMGWENIFHCEWNPFGQKVLKHHFPKSISYNDITKTDFTIHRGTIDILSGGFPCQPYSLAGKRKGKEDERHLWPEMLRAITEIQPSWVVGENVFGLINWSNGLVFHEVQTDLEAEGYEVFPYVLPACAVNAPHRRDRVWFVAYNQYNGNRRREQQQKSEQKKNRAFKNTNKDGWGSNKREEESSIGQFRDISTGDNERLCPNTCIALQNVQNATNTKNIGRKDALENGKLEGGRFRFGDKPPTWDSFPSQSPICGGDDGLPTELDGITFSKWRNESIKAFGNAIVPQVAFQIFKAIEEYGKQRNGL